MIDAPALAVLGIGCVELLLFLRTGFRLVRFESGILLACHPIYLGLLAFQLLHKLRRRQHDSG